VLPSPAISPRMGDTDTLADSAAVTDADDDTELETDDVSDTDADRVSLAKGVFELVSDCEIEPLSDAVLVTEAETESVG